MSEELHHAERKTRLFGLLLGPALVLLVLFLIFWFLPKPPNAARKEKMPAQALHLAQLAQLKMDKNACVWSSQAPDRYTCNFKEMDEDLMLRKLAAEGWEYRGQDASFGKQRTWEKYFLNMVCCSPWLVNLKLRKLAAFCNSPSRYEPKGQFLNMVGWQRRYALSIRKSCANHNEMP